MNQYKILVVEDDDVFHIMEEEALRKEGYEVYWTDATVVAKTYLEHGDFNLLVLDLDQLRRVPYGPLLSEEGLRFLANLRASPKFSKDRLAIIATTVYIPEEGPASFKERSFYAGADDFIEQPVTAAMLIPSVQRLLTAQSRVLT